MILRSVSKKVVIEEFGRTDVVGILEMLQASLLPSRPGKNSSRKKIFLF
jgi:hypothetical protein